MSGSALVSVIIPTYNRSQIVCEAVESVLRQTYKDIEVIVVDDGSSDDTCEKLKKFGEAIAVIRQQNAGPASARNTGIAASRGDLIAFLDSDDLWLPTKLERQVTLLERLGDSTPCCLSNIMMCWNDRQISSFDISWLKPELEEGLWVNVDEVLATRFVLFNQGVTIRRKVLEKIGGFDEGLRLLEDSELSLRLSLEGPWAYISEPLVIWRETQGSCYQQARAHGIAEKELLVAVLESHLARVEGQIPQPKRLIQVVRRELNRARRQLQAAGVQRMKFMGASLAGNALSAVERCRGAIFRRSPLFPRMKVESAISGDLSGVSTERAPKIQMGSC